MEDEDHSEHVHVRLPPEQFDAVLAWLEDDDEPLPQLSAYARERLAGPDRPIAKIRPEYVLPIEN